MAVRAGRLWIHRLALRSKAIDEDCLEASVSIYGAGPIAEETCGLATPRHARLIPLICGFEKPLGLAAGKGDLL